MKTSQAITDQSESDTNQLLRLALWLWLGYFLLIAFVDWRFADFDSIRDFGFYMMQALAGLMIIGAALLLPHDRLWSKRFRLGIYLLMLIIPTLIIHVAIHWFPNEIVQAPDATHLRLTPVYLMSVLLVAREQPRHIVILVCLSLPLINFGGILLSGPVLGTIFGRGALAQTGGPPPPRDLTQGPFVIIIQTISFLLVGYITSTLFQRLRAQQNALEEVNAKLVDQASTREELAISQERNRMARELHDTLAHTLSGLTVQLQTVKAYWEIEPATSRGMLDDALVATRYGLQETRGALKSLRATPLEDLGLPLAIRQLAEETAACANLDLQLAITEQLPPLAPEISHALYRVAQEAIMNVVYHANAKTLSVTVLTDTDGIQLTVADDGSGFDTKRSYPNHWGIEGMRERAQLVEGQLRTESQAGRGTTIQLTVPEKSS